MRQSTKTTFIATRGSHAVLPCRWPLTCCRVWLPELGELLFPHLRGLYVVRACRPVGAECSGLRSTVGSSILGEAHLRAVLIEYQTRYNTARPHQGIAQRVPGYECEAPDVTAASLDVQRIRRKSILNGLINDYSRAA